MDTVPSLGFAFLLSIIGVIGGVVSLIFLIIGVVRAFRMGCVIGLVFLLVPFAMYVLAFIKREELGKVVLISTIAGIIGFGAAHAAKELAKGKINAEIQRKMPDIVSQMSKEMQKNAPPPPALPISQPQSQPARNPVPTAASSGVVGAARSPIPVDSGKTAPAKPAPPAQPVILAGPQEKFVKSFHEKLTAMSTDLNNRRPQAGASAEEIAKYNAQAAAYANLLKEYKKAVADLQAARAREVGTQGAHQSSTPNPVR